MMKIESKTFNVPLLLHFKVWEDNGIHYATNELFNLTGYGNTHDEAMAMATNVINEYFEYTANYDTLEADMSTFRQLWIPVDKNNLPEHEVLAANFTPRTYPQHKLIGKLYITGTGDVMCRGHAEEIFYVSHYFDINKHDIQNSITDGQHTQLDNFYKMQQVKLALISLNIHPDSIMESTDPVAEAERVVNLRGFTLDEKGCLKALK